MNLCFEQSNYGKRAAAALLMIALTACGGGGTGATGGGSGLVAPSIPPANQGNDPIPVTTTTAVALSDGGTQVRPVGGRSQIEQAVAINGRLVGITVDGRTTIDPLQSPGLPVNVYSDGTSNLYALSTDADGVSFAVVGWRLGGVFEANTLGGVIRTPRGGHQTSGIATYNGDYIGYFTTAGVPTDITGNIEIDVDFSRDRFTADLTNRRVTSGVGRNFISPSIVEQAVRFAGTVSDAGLMRGGHRDANSVGSFTAQAHSGGAVGLVDIDHTGGGNAAQPDTLEVGTFAAN